jgi:putative Mn2+ efflux pump MntP
MGFCQAALVHVLLLSIGTLSVGFTLAYFGASYETCSVEFGLDTTMEQSWFNALTPILAIFGGIVAHLSMQRLGRKWPSLVGSVVVIIGWVLVVVSGEIGRAHV